MIENNYFVGNGRSDIIVGNITGSPLPIGVKILKNTKTAENSGVNPYGSFPYTGKINIVISAFTTISDNDMSISSAIPLIGINALAVSTNGNGLCHRYYGREFAPNGGPERAGDECLL